MEGAKDGDPIRVKDHFYADGQLPPVRRHKYISPGYFKTMGNRLVAGRDLTWDDIAGKRAVVLVSENLAREYWGEPVKALGKQIRENLNGSWREIVGVAANDRDDGPDHEQPSAVYWPLL